MDATEVVAVIILIVAIAVLVYYYLLNSPATMDKLKTYVPTSADAHMDEVLNKANAIL
jgi:predicted PurR-regulated permease PerM